MKLTENEKQVVSAVLERVIDNVNKEEGFAGGPLYCTDEDLLMSFTGENIKALKRALKKIERDVIPEKP